MKPFPAFSSKKSIIFSLIVIVVLMNHLEVGFCLKAIAGEYSIIPADSKRKINCESFKVIKGIDIECTEENENGVSGRPINKVWNYPLKSVTINFQGIKIYPYSWNIDNIQKSINDKKCNEIIENLYGPYLIDNRPYTYVFAGSLYENGLCFNKDISKAIWLYQQAVDASPLNRDLLIKINHLKKIGNKKQDKVTIDDSMTLDELLGKTKEKENAHKNIVNENAGIKDNNSKESLASAADLISEAGALNRLKARGLSDADAQFVLKSYKIKIQKDFFKAAQLRDMSEIKNLLDEGVAVNAKDNEGRTALMMASSSGSVNIVELLLAKDVDINAKSYTGITALHFATLKNNVDVVELLLSKGADVNAKIDNGKTALMIASNQGYSDILRLLVQHGAY